MGHSVKPKAKNANRAKEADWRTEYREAQCKASIAAFRDLGKILDDKQLFGHAIWTLMNTMPFWHLHDNKDESERGEFASFVLEMAEEARDDLEELIKAIDEFDARARVLTSLTPGRIVRVVNP